MNKFIQWNIAALALVTWYATASHAQSKISDDKIRQIESFRKFKITKSDKNDLAAMNGAGDSSIRVISLTNYISEKTGLGKVEQRSRYQGTEVKRTCYFSTAGKLFAIRDSIWYDNHTQRQLTYYLTKGKLDSVIDNHQENVIANINQAELFNWLSSMFADEDIH